MGNKTCIGNKSKIAFQQSQSQPKSQSQSIVEYDTDKYSIVPNNLKFKKIDLIKYGEIFDQYKQDHVKTSKMEYEIQQIANTYNDPNNYTGYTEEKWYLFNQVRYEIIEHELHQYQFPLQCLLRFVITYNQNELLEFILTQELIECDLWCRDYFKCHLFHSILFASKLLKLSLLNTIASYMIPERISKNDFKFVIEDAYLTKYYTQLCNEMVEQGMNKRMERMNKTKQVLLYCDFPYELIAVVIGYAFGTNYKY